jgi:hypothetical protein
MRRPKRRLGKIALKAELQQARGSRYMAAHALWGITA